MWTATGLRGISRRSLSLFSQDGNGTRGERPRPMCEERVMAVDQRVILFQACLSCRCYSCANFETCTLTLPTVKGFCENTCEGIPAMRCREWRKEETP